MTTAQQVGFRNGMINKYSIIAILIFGSVLRLVLFCGDGLGDDPNYFAAFKNIYDGRMFNSQYYYRFSYWIPQIVIWKIFGINEFTFILPVLLSSIGCIYVVYLIGRELFDIETGLIAATLMAVNPFEVLNATLISTDVNLSLYMLLAVYFFVVAQRHYSAFYFVLSALFIFLAFVNKLFGAYILPVILGFYLAREGWDLRKISRYLTFMVSLMVLFLILFITCWFLVGDPFTYITIFGQNREPPHIAPLDAYQLMIYPNQMFFKNEFGESLHGYHFYGVVLCLLIGVRNNVCEKIFPVLVWFLVMFFFVEFFPHKVRDFIPYTIPRIFRYFVIVVPPSIIFVSYYWNRFRKNYQTIFAVAFAVYVAFSIPWSYESTRIARIAFGEVRDATTYLKNQNGDIYSDWYLISKIERLENGGRRDPRLHAWINTETPEAWQQKFLSVETGYVVTGGPRLPYYGCFSCIPNLGHFVPPRNWRMLREFDDRGYPPWKVEPLRIWYVEKR
ncbi:Dolichyl-phosphate-mannose-protein mannosyltransferase [Candidatus Methylomirabilis lanthanidiphila]|uniref:Dolichyl-phosphate-mannose-protein mannosyltransferase n=1 Tax=Candidatus Methylomirabilis lanthanidiphila TaxID=2211376 RepID=A0A564ZHT1_9BACT|nr:glycosyltransferase family 39 protein [Candidatus Methylomirabilis lanthanidiphila]VUZ84477.1 Dolichyl-phosphate-mannose-protein mannosyltransferase [Candidatus Methylomirabilis lanthanidiphila]